MPSIVDLRKKLEGKVEFLLVSPLEGIKIIKEYKAAKGIDFPLYVNGSDVPENLKFKAYPTTFIIDKNKQIVYKWEGAFDWDSKEVINKLIELSLE
jgi:peroxiredoxin